MKLFERLKLFQQQYAQQSPKIKRSRQKFYWCSTSLSDKNIFDGSNLLRNSITKVISTHNKLLLLSISVFLYSSFFKFPYFYFPSSAKFSRIRTRSYDFKICGCFPKILLGLFLNTLFHMLQTPEHVTDAFITTQTSRISSPTPS